MLEKLGVSLAGLCPLNYYNKLYAEEHQIGQMTGSIKISQKNLI